jgi:hypothetical protein
MSGMPPKADLFRQNVWIAPNIGLFSPLMKTGILCQEETLVPIAAYGGSEPMVTNAAMSTNNGDAPNPRRSKRTTVFPKADVADGSPQGFNDLYQPFRLRPPAA